LTRLFGFTQLDLPGTLPLADGRYVLRDGEAERVLVLQTLGAPPPPRRRRRVREVQADARPAVLPLTRATVVRAFEPFGGEQPASSWLKSAIDSEQTIDGLIAEALGAINRALHAQAVASGDPHLQALSVRNATSARLGYGTGEQVAVGDFAEAREVEPQTGHSRKRQRHNDLRPQERVAALLGRRERPDACETLLLRARADLDAGRPREAALQLRVGLDALLVELDLTSDDAGHAEDIAKIRARREAAAGLADSALKGDLSAKELEVLVDLLRTGERALRRRRVLSE
jgi:hypothetical protein